MENPEVAGVFEEVADLLDIQGANPFRVRAYRMAARTIRDLSAPLAGADEETLCELDGIGADLAGKIRSILETGDLPLRQELRQSMPPGLRDLISIAGLGPKRARTLHEKLKIGSLDDLRHAAKTHRISKLAGFGEKMETAILRALEGRQESAKRFQLVEAKVFADAVVRHLKETRQIAQIEVAGSYRRHKETVGDLDVLVTCKQPDAAMDRLRQFEPVAEVLARGDTKMSVRLRNGLQLDLRVVPDESFGSALQYFTGSKEHSIVLRRMAQERGLKINEYGVFRGATRIAGRTEEEVYESVGLPWIAPELREARSEFAWAEQGRLPRLVELDDLQADLHMHTTATDGRASIEAMICAAKARGYRYVAITDHSKRVTMARGLDARRLRAHWKQIEKAAEEVKGLTVLKGVELDILEDGSLDLPDDVLAEADWVVASIHYGQGQPRDRITARVLGAIRHPHVHAIGHPTGRLIGRRPEQALDLDAVMQAAADYGCLLEVNAQPDRLDLNDVALLAAKKRGVRFVIDTDAHSVEELGFMEFGVFQARRGGLEPKDVANTRSLAQFRKLLKK
jgi:DNA polymerase (family 10)